MFEIVVRAIIKDAQGRVLLAKRVKAPEKGKWALVGGKVELFEKAEDAVVREVREELGIVFRPNFVGYGETLDKYGSVHTLVLCFDGEWEGRILPKDDEINDAQFFSIGKLDELDIAWDHRKQIMQRLPTLNQRV